VVGELSESEGKSSGILEAEKGLSADAWQVVPSLRLGE
jgi:hypothetical protein